MQELKPCPFCGGEVEYTVLSEVHQDTTKTHKIYCKNVFNCGCSMIDLISPYQPNYNEEVEKLKERWNKRAAAERPENIKALTIEEHEAITKQNKIINIESSINNKVLVLQEDGFFLKPEDAEAERLKMVEQIKSGVVVIPSYFDFKCIDEIDSIKTEVI